jgi:hypothetical protein
MLGIPESTYPISFEVAGQGKIIHTQPHPNITGSSIVLLSATEIFSSEPHLGAANNISIANVVPQKGSVSVVINTGWSGSSITIKVSGIIIS